MKKESRQEDSPDILKRDIRNKTAGRLYFFYGEETFLLHHYLEQLQKLLLDPLTEAFNFHKLTNETFTIQDFLNGVENLPMMAEHTLVWVDEVDIFKLPEGDREKLAQTFGDIPDYCTVVFTYETTPWKPDKRQKKLWTAVEANGCPVEFPKQDARSLVPWIGRHFAAAGKKISPELCTYLMEITGGTMTALAGEIGKICAFAPGETIEKSHIDSVTEPVLDAVVFQMTDLMGAGEYGKALLKLSQLLKMQQEPLSILGAIGSHFRRISAARTLLDRGRPSGELMRLCGMSDYAARRTMQAAGRFSPRFCRTAANLVLETDYAIKTSYDDPQRLLELLVLRLSQEARNG